MEIEKRLKESNSQYEYSHLKKYFAEEAFNRPKIDLNNLEAHKKNLQHEMEKLEKMSSNLHLASQQIELYSHEAAKAQAKIADANSKFNKDTYVQMIKLKKFPTEFENLVDRFMLILDLKERGWNAFKELNSNFASVKVLMNSYSPENLKQEIIDQILPLWKNYAILSPLVTKTHKGAQYLLDWITGLLELKIKSDTLKTAKKKFPELQKKVKDQIDLIAETNAVIRMLQEKKTQQSQYQHQSQQQQYQSPISTIQQDVLPSPISLPNQLKMQKADSLSLSKNPTLKSPLASPRNISNSTSPKQLLASPNYNLKMQQPLIEESKGMNDSEIYPKQQQKFSNKSSNISKFEDKDMSRWKDKSLEKSDAPEALQRAENSLNKAIINNNKISEESDINIHDISDINNEIEISSNDINILSYDQAKKPLPQASSSVDYHNLNPKNLLNVDKSINSKSSLIIMNNLRNMNDNLSETIIEDTFRQKSSKQNGNIESEYVSLKNEFKSDMKVQFKNASFQEPSNLNGLREISQPEPKVELQSELPGCYRKSIRRYFCV